MTEKKDIYHLHVELPRPMYDELLSILNDKGLLSILVRRLLRIYIEQRKKVDADGAGVMNDFINETNLI